MHLVLLGAAVVLVAATLLLAGLLALSLLGYELELPAVGLLELDLLGFEPDYLNVFLFLGLFSLLYRTRSARRLEQSVVRLKPRRW